jgi:hypothetical protein
MPKSGYANELTSASEAHRRDSIVQFLAELLQVTGGPEDQEAFQRSLQTYVNGLRPWMEPGDGPQNPRVKFTLFERCTFDASGEQISVVLSPEAEALFRAWLRRNKIWSDAGLHTAHAWSN